MNILNFRSNRNLNAYKISLNIKKFIDSWTNQTYIKNLIKKLSYISKIPTNILSYEIKQILSGNFRFSEGKFTNKLALKSTVYDALIFFSLLIIYVSGTPYAPKPIEIIPLSSTMIFE